MSKITKRLFLFIVSLFLITLGVFYVFGISSLTRDGIDIVNPENGTRIYAFQNFALNANLLVTNATTNVTWYIQDTVGVNTSIFSHNFAQNTTNGTSNYTGGWGAVAQGRYNITLVASNDTQYSTNGTNLSVGGIGTCTLSASQQCNNATGGYNILLINKLDQLSYTTNLSGLAINIVNPTAGQNISGNFTFNATIADLNMTSNVTWIISNASRTDNFTLGANNALNNLNVTNNTAFIGDGTYNIFLRATNNTNHTNIINGSILNTARISSFNGTTVLVASVVIDNTLPNVNLDSPTDASTDADGLITFSFTVIENNIANCSLLGDFNKSYSINQTNTTGISNNTSFSFRELNLEGNTTGGYKWNVECADSANNRIRNTTNFTVFVGTPAAPPGGRSGGGGSSGSERGDIGIITRNGVITTIQEGNSVSFFAGNARHILKVVQVKSPDLIKITIFSHPITFEIIKGETKNLDINDDKKSDISVTFVDIDSRKNVKLMIKEFQKEKPLIEAIKEIVGMEEKPTMEEKVKEIGISDEIEEVKPKNNLGIILGIILVILLVTIIYFYFKKDKKNLK